MFRDKEEKFIPTNSTLGKNSNLFGTLSNNFNEFINQNMILLLTIIIMSLNTIIKYHNKCK